MNLSRARAITTTFPQFRVAVVGDLMLDRYIWGSASRISYEAPVPVVKVRRRKSTLGGAANVLRNLTTLSMKAYAFGVIGTDARGDEFCDLCNETGVETRFIQRLDDRPTTVKTRVIAENQQVARIDDESCDTIPDAAAEQLLKNLATAIENDGIQAVILEDYDKGVITPDLATAVVELCRKHKIRCTLDPHPANPLEVKGLTLMTPNRAESFALIGDYFRDTVMPIDQDKPLQDVAAKIMSQWSPDNLLITLGAGGMVLFQKDGTQHHIPTVAREVFDVSGAGDTVIATCTAALMAGAGPIEACELANHAGGVVVGKIGTVPILLDELLNSFAAD